MTASDIIGGTFCLLLISLAVFIGGLICGALMASNSNVERERDKQKKLKGKLMAALSEEEE